MKGVDGPLPGHIFFACASSTPVKMKRNTCNHVATTHWAYPPEIVIKIHFLHFTCLFDLRLMCCYWVTFSLLVQVQLLSK